MAELQNILFDLRAKVELGPMKEPVPGLAAKAAQRLERLARVVADRRPIASHGLSFSLEWLADRDALAAIDSDLKNLVTRNERIVYQFSALD